MMAINTWHMFLTDDQLVIEAVWSVAFGLWDGRNRSTMDVTVVLVGDEDGCYLGGFNLWAFHIFSHVKADVHRDFQRCSHGGLFNTCLRFKRHFWWWNSRLLAVLAAWFQSCNPSIQAGSWTDNIKQLFCTHGLAWSKYCLEDDE